MTTTTVPEAPAVGRNDDFRRRLLDGLAASIEERGYRDSTVADIVRYARTSKRTFYSEFATKEDCFAELLTANNDELVETISAAVDPHALARADPPGCRHLRRAHRRAAGHHAELDPGTSRAG